MAASTATNVAPVLAWDKNQSTLKPPRKKTNPLMAISVVAIVLLAMSGIWRAIHQAPAGKFIKVVAAVHDIPAGTRLGFLSVKYLDVPKEFATHAMVLSLNDINERVTRTFVPAGEPILFSDLFPGHDGLSVNLENDERAITLQLNDDALVDHAIQPDDRVDILAVSNHEGQRYTKTICQDARVLMSAPKEQLLAKRMASSTNNKITLAVTPQLAELVTEAAETGKVRLVLRNHLGRTSQHLAGAEPKDLLPPSALIVEKKVTAVALNKTYTDSSFLTVPPPPVTPSLPTPPAIAPPSTPLEWLVTVFSGAKKEVYGVPQK
jgi:Flp pilus assembly protein CpaB